MISRRALEKLEVSLSRFPVVALLGPRQVGKTTLAWALQESLESATTRYLDLESPVDRAKLADAEAYLEAQQGRLVILDEVHRTPALFEVLRVIVDRRRAAGERVGQFLVLGSASLDSLRQSSESLAGRIAFVELTPLLPQELPADRDTVEHIWVRGGFPDSYLAADDAVSLQWRRAFVRTYLERDVPLLGPRIPAETLRRFWTMLAHTQGQLLNAAKLAAGLGVSGQTVARYLDLLVDLLLVRRLQPWSGNVGKRLVKSTKLYLRDSGIVHALLDIESHEDLLGHPVVGPSWEGLVLESLLAAAGDARTSFYRTSAGAEIDLVIEGRKQSCLAVEVKRSTAPTVSKGFRLACEDVRATQRIVVYPGAEEFQLGGGLSAVSLHEAVERVQGLFGQSEDST